MYGQILWVNIAMKADCGWFPGMISMWLSSCALCCSWFTRGRSECRQTLLLIAASVDRLGSSRSELLGSEDNTDREILCPNGRKCWDQSQWNGKWQTPRVGDALCLVKQQPQRGGGCEKLQQALGECTQRGKGLAWGWGRTTASHVKLFQRSGKRVVGVKSSLF